MAAPLIERFVAKVDWPTVVTACWPWAARVDHDGYGRIRHGKRDPRAHRVSYELFRGPIPDGLHIDHLCRVRNCVNPLHLEAVPQVVNNLRGESPWAMNARKTHCPQGHEFTEANIYRRPGRMKRDCRKCRSAADARRRDRRKAGSR